MFDWLESTLLAVWVKELGGWAFALTFHAFGTAIMVGVSFILCLRLLGLFKTIPTVSLASLIPFIWIGLGIQAFSGSLLSLTTPGTYFTALAFMTKLAIVVLGLLFTMSFQRAVRLDADDAASSKTVSRRCTQFATLTALAWAIVLILSRYSEKVCTYSGECWYMFSPSWPALLVIVVLGIGFALMRALDKKT